MHSNFAQHASEMSVLFLAIMKQEKVSSSDRLRQNSATALQGYGELQIEKIHISMSYQQKITTKCSVKDIN